ncbi:DUF92 domain-containing protein [Thermococcus sp. M39]|uniref:DUF92 domain-containing protein n=1 Tax=unclassified Thermococcus TaxID=2627626 RepID=UPI00143C9453|nr:MULTISPECIES: TIGR00297 family protein [unclassified Thermococcus]NJE07789.1 DUF92 domain-containing protein [Thermococcus sp. M39]NJE12344.1 DUF92 domain-containing protein [Thermococcus sp. LS2]
MAVISAIQIAIIFVFGYLAYIGHALDKKGSIVAAVLGLFILQFGGVYPFLALLVFVIMGVLSTKYKYSEKLRSGIAQERKGIRSWGNVLGNGLGAVIFVILEYITRQDFLWAATFASIATANADTLASELGKVLGKEPRMITNFKPAKPGANGAISIQGEIFALVGAMTIGVIAMVVTQYKWQIFLATLLGGFIGCNIDSIVGATLENKGIVDNNGTNFIATLAGGIAGAIIFLALV